jgi:hypothetical protein
LTGWKKTVKGKLFDVWRSVEQYRPLLFVLDGEKTGHASASPANRNRIEGKEIEGAAPSPKRRSKIVGFLRI